MIEFRIYPAVVEAVQELQSDDRKIRRIELCKETKQKLLEELGHESGIEPYFSAIFDAEVEIRDDVDGFKIVAERSNSMETVKVISGEEYLEQGDA